MFEGLWGADLMATGPAKIIYRFLKICASKVFWFCEKHVFSLVFQYQQESGQNGIYEQPPRVSRRDQIRWKASFFFVLKGEEETLTQRLSRDRVRVSVTRRTD